MPTTGRCQCGGVAYEIAGSPIKFYVCHCTECRRQSASAFGISAIVRAADFCVTRGSPTSWSRPTDSGKRLDCHFCPDCGSRLFHTSTGSATVSVKGDSLDVPPDLAGAIHIWTARKLAGVTIPAGATQFPGEPP
jgi:hypothetical protein